GCAHDPEYPRGTIRMVEGRRVLGRYISPSAYQHYIQAELYADQDAHEAAVEELRQAIGSDPDAPELHTRLAQELLRLTRLDAADMEIAHALRLDPKHAEAFVAQAAIRRARHDLPGAISVLQSAVSADPQDEEVYIELARAQHESGDAAASRKTLQRLCEKL